MATLLQYPTVARPRASTSSGILINRPTSPATIPTTTTSSSAPLPNIFISNAPSNNSIASSSSSGNNTDDALSLHSYQSVSQSASGTATPVHTRPGARSSSIPSARRIRFAPLPDPRSLESEGADESLIGIIPGVDGDFISAKLDSSASDAVSGTMHPSLSLLSCSSQPTDISKSPSSSSSCFSSSTLNPTSSGGDTSINTSSTTLPDSYDDATPTSNSPTLSKKSLSSTTWSAPKKLFKPFLRRSSSPMAPASGFNISTEDILTLGAINLFRTSSRESRSGASMSSEDGPGSGHSNGNGLGLSLSRWTSAKSYSGSQKNNGKEWFGSPLARTESTQSYKGDLRSRRPQTAPAAASSPTPTTPKPKPKPKTSPPMLSTQVPLKNRRKGTRMLNGRVYGARRIDAQNTNMFETVKDEEPEFVEWGYGGMGSVKAGKQHGGTQWSRLQSDKAMSGGGGVDDPDDGGGMEWVRKRKEKREKEKKEREEAEAAKGAAEPSPVQNQPLDPPLSTVTEELQLADTAAPASTSPADETVAPALEQLQPSPSMLLSPPDKDVPADPLTVTVTVPVPAPPRPHHFRAASHSGSVNTNTSHSQVNSSANLGLEGDKEREREIGGMELAIERLDGDKARNEGDNVSDSGSESGSDSGCEGEGEEDPDDDEPEDEDEDERIRKTALGAGVEKISRHKEDS